jgi:hypothetical protein
MHPQLSNSNQYSDHWTTPSSLNKSPVLTKTDLCRLLSSAEEGNVVLDPSTSWTMENQEFLSIYANSKNISPPLGLVFSSLIDFQHQTIFKWGALFSRYFNFTREYIFFGEYGGRRGGVRENHSTPVYFDANNRIYR